MIADLGLFVLKAIQNIAERYVLLISTLNGTLPMGLMTDRKAKNSDSSQ